MMFCIPENIDKKLLLKMYTISSEIQKNAAKQRPHNVRDIIANESLRLSEQCEEGNVPFLWDCLSVLHKKLALKVVTEEEEELMQSGINASETSQAQTFRDQLSHLPATVIERHKILDLYVRCWVENMSSKITTLLKTSSYKDKFGTLFDVSQDQVHWLFQKMFHAKNNQTKNKYDIFQFQLPY